jgi:hypothetical protein
MRPAPAQYLFPMNDNPSDATASLPHEASEIEARARRDFAEIRGKVLVLDHVETMRDYSSLTLALPEPTRFRVLETADCDIARWCCDWCDPVWDVEPLDANRPEFAGCTSFWVHGSSYRVGTGERQEAAIVRVEEVEAQTT